MTHILITNIQWDDEGQGLEECQLPKNVVVLDVPTDFNDDYIQNQISESLSDSFGFSHYSFAWELLSEPIVFPERLAVIKAPEL